MKEETKNKMRKWLQTPSTDANRQLVALSSYARSGKHTVGQLARVSDDIKKKKLGLRYVSKHSSQFENLISSYAALWERFLGLAGGRNVRLHLRIHRLEQIPLANKKIPHWLFGSKFRLARGKKRKIKNRRIPGYRRQLVLRNIKKEAQRRAIFRSTKQLLRKKLCTNLIKQTHKRYISAVHLAKKDRRFFVYLATKKAQVLDQKFSKDLTRKLK